MNMAVHMIMLFLCFTLKYSKVSSVTSIVLALTFSILGVFFLPNTFVVPNFSLQACYYQPPDFNPSSLINFFFRRSSNKLVLNGHFNSADVVIKIQSGNSICEEETQCTDNFQQFLTQKENIQNIIVCPEATNFMNLISKIEEPSFLHVDFNMLAESLLLQIIPAEENWPVPRLLNACGVVLIEERIGETLSSMEITPWYTRLTLAKNLLDLAGIFTFQHQNFSFYFTDLSPDNIGVRENLDVVLIDLDNVIIVDRTESGVLHKSGVHVTEIFEGDTEVWFSPTDICSHNISDHNFVMVCQHILLHSSILGGGLLKGVPEDIKRSNGPLEEYLQECSRPSKNLTRFAAAEKLRNVLNEILSNHFNV